MQSKIFSIGPIRPPSEMTSLLLQVTKNCTWNRCNFCTLYENQKFKMRTVDEIKKDIDTMAFYKDLILSHIKEYKNNKEYIHKYYSNLNIHEQNCYDMIYNWIVYGKMNSMFIQDANSIVVKSDILSDIISYVKYKIPEIKKITSYGRADTLSNIKYEEYLKLKKSGLTRIHSGFETGSNNVLKLLNKGTTKEQQIDAGKKIKQSGIELSIYFMPGCGGTKFMNENATETADVINKINPDFIRLRTFVVKYNSYMQKLVDEKKFIECSDINKVKEIKILIENINSCDGYIESDHIINLLENIKGNLKTDINNIISYIDEFLNLNDNEQKIFQVIRRSGFNGDFKNIQKLPNEYINNVNKYINDINKNEIIFEEALKNQLNNYI